MKRTGLAPSVARGCLRTFGWRVVGARSDAAKYVLIAAPHTSNWDFPLMLLCGIPVGEQHWKLLEVNRMLFLRALARAGSWGATDGSLARSAH